MAEGKAGGGGEGLSLQTLVVAALASAVAAIVVSHLWKDGTVIAAAMTPVIVALVKEMLARPLESELVRKPVQQVGRLASQRIAVPGGIAGRPGGQMDVPASTEEETGAANGAGTPPIKTYGRTRRRPVHLKIALITGLVAFLIAAAALTLPELLFGGAISSHHSTTLFGGGGKSKSDNGKTPQDGKTSTQPQQSQQQNGQTTPTAPPSAGSTTKPPPTSPSSTTPQQQQPQPQQTPPQQTSPVPTTPTPPTP
jgi:hypothetical protein